MPLYAQLLLLFLIGIFTGFINILAGGGSLLSLPLLLFLGLPAALANGTNRVAILIQNFAGVAGFHQQRVFPWRVGLLAAAPALIGTFIGASFAVDISDLLFKRLLALIMVAVLGIVILDPASRIRRRHGQMSPARRAAFVIGFFLVGLYGGFIQAGVGFIIITLMALAGFDMVQTNAVKVFVVFIFTVAALGVFIAHGQVNYLLGFALGAGNALGAYVATHVAVRKGHNWVRGFVVVLVIIFAVKLLLDSFTFA